MCGRFIGFTAEQEKDIVEIVRSIDRRLSTSTIRIQVKYEGDIYPTNIVPVVLNKDGTLLGSAMQWGFPGFPDRRKPLLKPRPLINAKTETAQDLVTWRDSLVARRCIIPSNGFYEWTHEGQKIKYRFNEQNTDALYMAAIYQEFKVNGMALPHFSILTTQANASMMEIHNRMPVILARHEFDQWLTGNYMEILHHRDTDLKRVPA